MKMGRTKQKQLHVAVVAQALTKLEEEEGRTTQNSPTHPCALHPPGSRDRVKIAKKMARNWDNHNMSESLLLEVARKTQDEQNGSADWTIS